MSREVVTTTPDGKSLFWSDAGPEFGHLVSFDGTPACGACGQMLDLIRGQWSHSDESDDAEACDWGKPEPVPSKDTVFVVKYREHVFGIFTNEQAAIRCKKKATDNFGTRPLIILTPLDRIGDLTDSGWDMR